MMFGRGFNGYNSGRFFGGCLRNGLWFNGWGMLIWIGILITAALLIFFIVNHNRKKNMAFSSHELLKLKFVKGEITEEEYIRRREVLDRD